MRAQLVMMHEEVVATRCLVASVRAAPHYQHRPDLPDAIEFEVKKNIRLTSPTYYRDVFHIELAPRDPHHKLEYLPVRPKLHFPLLAPLLSGV